MPIKAFYNNIFLVSILIASQTITAASDFYYGDSSGLFITRWAFQSICDHIFDPYTSEIDLPTSSTGVIFDADKVKAGDKIFVRNVKLFFEKLHPYIKQPYIMITHGEAEATVKDDYYRYLENNTIIAWFSIHPPQIGHKKFFPIPLGIPSWATFKEWTNDDAYNELNIYLKTLREEVKKTKLMYMNFSFNTSEDRLNSKNIFLGWTFSSFAQNKPFEEYMEEMAAHKFALSPRGLGPDCYRTWEALLVGVIPIVKRGEFDTWATPKNKKRLRRGSELDKLYEDLPVLIIDDWSEINEAFLNHKYLEITSRRYSIEKLYTKYWHSKIQNLRDEFLQQRKS